MNTGQTSPFLGVTKKQVLTLPRVVWVEESKNGLGFEIGPNYDDVPTRSQLLTPDRIRPYSMNSVERYLILLADALVQELSILAH